MYLVCSWSLAVTSGPPVQTLDHLLSMLGSALLRWSENTCTLEASSAAQVSSTQYFQNLRVLSEVASDLSLASSMIS